MNEKVKLKSMEEIFGGDGDNEVFNMGVVSTDWISNFGK